MQEADLAPLCSSLRSFGSKCTVLKKVFVTLLGLYGAPILIRRRGIVPPLPPLVTPLCSRGHFRYAVKRAKRFVNVHWHCIVSNIERISKISSLPPLEKFLRTPVLLTWISSSFWHFSDMFWLFLTCKYNKQKYLNYINFNKPFLCNIQSLET